MKFVSAATDLPVDQMTEQIATVAALIVLALFLFWSGSRVRRRSRRGKSPRWPVRGTQTRAAAPAVWPGTSFADPTAQIQAVNQSEYERVRLLNREEAPLLPLLERTVRDLGAGHRVMAQTSLAEVIRPKGRDRDSPQARAAHAAINSKRLDFAVIDRFGYLVCAVEYQGSGHHLSGAFIRDAVKREALRKAGVPMLEVAPNHDPALVAASLRDILQPATTSRASA